MDLPRYIELLISCSRVIRNLQAVLVFSISFSTAWAVSPGSAVRMEVFTTTDCEVAGLSVTKINEQTEDIDLQVYHLNMIQLVEAELSSNLPTDPHQAKQIALQRFQQLDGQSTSAVQNTAVGLAKAMQYDIDRYPAIVFDGRVVVYGLTDLRYALDHYQAWQAKHRP